MDLSKAEKTISLLEEHGKKVAKISEAVEKFEKLSNELKVLPDQIEKNNSSTAVRILELEKKFEKENDNLGKIFKESFKDLNNNNYKEKEELSKKIEMLTHKYVEESDNLRDEIKVLNKSLSEQGNKIKKLQISGIVITLLTFFIISYVILKF